MADKQVHQRLPVEVSDAFAQQRLNLPDTTAALLVPGELGPGQLVTSQYTVTSNGPDLAPATTQRVGAVSASSPPGQPVPK